MATTRTMMDRRHYARVVFPEQERPRLLINNQTLRIMEISCSGARISNDSHFAWITPGKSTIVSLVFGLGKTLDVPAQILTSSKCEFTLSFQPSLTSDVMGLIFEDSEDAQPRPVLPHPEEPAHDGPRFRETDRQVPAAMHVPLCVTDYPPNTLREDEGLLINSRKCYEYFYNRTSRCPDCLRSKDLSDDLERGYAPSTWCEPAEPIRMREFQPGHKTCIDNDAYEQMANLIKRLWEERERFEQLAAQSREIIWEVDAQGLITYISPTSLDILGYAPSEIEGILHFYDFHPQEGRDAHKAVNFTEAFALQRSFRDYQSPVVTKDGREIWLSTNGIPVLNSDGEFMGYRGTHADVTEKLAREAQNTKLQHELHVAQKMEAVGQLAGGIAHDFNNLLLVIMGYMDIAEESLAETDPLRALMTEVQKASTKASALVRRLLTFSRCRNMEPEIVDLNELTGDFTTLLRRVIGEHINFELITCSEASIALCDRGMIEQVLMNLCVNARDAMGSSGRLLIRVENVEVDEGFCRINQWAKPGRYVTLSVSDTGCGMDEETKDRIFEPFFTTKGNDKGTGLGLSSVYGIVRQHNGMIHVYSEPEKGSRFLVYLPGVGGTPADVMKSHELHPPERGSETILFAEDDEHVRRLSSDILAQAGYTVIQACDGQEAVQLLREHCAEIDLLLLDVVMPSLGGREICEQAQDICPGVPTLFTSGYDESSIHKDFILREGMALLEKPYSMRSLLKRIRAVLDS